MRQFIRLAMALAVIVIATASGKAASFRVYADDSVGSHFPNTSNSPITIEVFAHGTWNCDPGRLSDHGPTGVSLIGTRSHRLPGARVGSLIVLRVLRGEGRFENVGRHRKLTVRPHEVLYFMINDERHEHAYRDNTGFVTIEWRTPLPVWRVDE